MNSSILLALFACVIAFVSAQRFRPAVERTDYIPREWLRSRPSTYDFNEYEEQDWTISGCVTIKGVKVCSNELDAIIDAYDLNNEGVCVSYKGVQVCNNEIAEEKISGCVTYKGVKVCNNEEEYEEQGLKKIVKKVGKAVKGANVDINISNQEWTVSGCVTVKGVKVCKNELDELIDAYDLNNEGVCVTYKGVQVCNNEVAEEKISGCVTYKGVKVCNNEEEYEEQGLKKIVKKVGKAVKGANVDINISNEDWTISGCVTIKGVKVCSNELDAIIDAYDLNNEGVCVTYKGVQVCNNEVAEEKISGCVTYKGVKVCNNEEEEYEEQGGLKKIVKKVGKAVKGANVDINISNQSFDEDEIQQEKISGCVTYKGVKVCNNEEEEAEIVSQSLKHLKKSIRSSARRAVKTAVVGAVLA